MRAHRPFLLPWSANAARGSTPAVLAFLAGATLCACDARNPGSSRMEDGAGNESPSRPDASSGTEANTGSEAGPTSVVDAAVPRAVSREGLMRSGSRLRARVQIERGAGEDAAGVFVGWHDGDLDMNCHFVKDDDESYHCVPSNEQSIGSQVYSTSACEPGTGLLARFVSGDGSEACSNAYVWQGLEELQCPLASPGTTLHVLGPVDASLATHGFVKSASGDCNPRGAPPMFDLATTWSYCRYEVVSSVQLVRAMERVEQVGGLRQRVLRAEDGAVELRTLLHPSTDTMLLRDWWRGEELVPNVQERTEPPRVVADGRCTACIETEPMACITAQLVRHDACTAQAYLLGKRAISPHACDGDQALSGFAPSCDLATPLPSIPYREIAVGTSRLRPLWITQDDEPVQPTAYFHDQVLDTTCRPQETDDGSVRCVPFDPGHTYPDLGSQGFLRAFSDPTCETSLGFEYKPQCGETAPTYRVEGTSQVWRMTSMGRPDAAATYTGFAFSDGRVVSCTPDGQPATEVFDARRVDPDELAEVEEVLR